MKTKTSKASTARKPRQPIYKRLAVQLTSDIEKDLYKVGDILPTEEALSKMYKVSRHTVREALREIKEDGLITSRARIGTVVKRKPTDLMFLNGINTIVDLLQFVDATEMHIIETKKIKTNEILAKDLNCPVGQQWVTATIIRKMPEHARPLSYLQLYLIPEYADVLKGATVFFKPIYLMVEARHRVKIIEIAQDITAANLSKSQAVVLKATEGQAALKIRRTYYDKAGAVVQISNSLYPSGRFVQSSRFRAQLNEG